METRGPRRVERRGAFEVAERPRTMKNQVAVGKSAETFYQMTPPSFRDTLRADASLASPEPAFLRSEHSGSHRAER